MKLNVTEDERALMVTAMSTAADQYSHHAQQCREIMAEEQAKGANWRGTQRLAEQFERQAKDALRLMVAIQDAED